MTNANVQFENFTGRWIGDIRGTTVANAYAESFFENGNLVWEIHFKEGQNTGKLRGTLQADQHQAVTLNYMMVNGALPPAHTPTITFKIEQLAASVLSGRWESTDGEAGIVALRRIDSTGSQAKVNTSLSVAIHPPELISKESRISAITLYRGEVEAIVKKLESILPTPSRAVMIGTIDANKIHQFAGDFLNRGDLPPKMFDVQFNIIDNSTPISKTISINLNKQGNNNLVVQSGDPTWTAGVSADLNQFMSRYSSRGLDFYKRHALNLNGLLLLITLAALPSLPILDRYISLLLVVVFIAVFAKLHNAVQHTRICLDSTQRGRLSKEVPALVMTVLAAILVGFLTWLWDLLVQINFSRYVSEIPAFGS